MRSISVVLFVLAVACTKQNPNVCCTTQADCDAQGLPLGTSCAQGLVCRGNQCIAETCTSSAMCDPAAPYCVASLCGEMCGDDSQCPGFGQDPGDKFCSGGACVACRIGMADCPSTAPICDANACRGCTHDDECPSRVCAAEIGTCVPESSILYAAPGASPSGTCSLASPCAINYATGMISATRHMIRMLPGTYPNDLSIGVGVNATLIGTGATLTGSAATGDLVYTDTGSNITIRGLTIQPGTRRAILCFSNSGTSMLALSDVDVEGLVQGSGCHLGLLRSKVRIAEVDAATTLTADRSLMLSLSAGGAMSSVLTITNSVIKESFSLPTTSAPLISGRVSFSTIGPLLGQVNCNGMATAGLLFDNDIIVMDPQSFATNALLGATACFDHDIAYPQSNPIGTNMINLDPRLVDTANNDFHLAAGSPAIDAADPAATDAVDYDGTVRPQGAGRDRGAFEYH